MESVRLRQASERDIPALVRLLPRSWLVTRAPESPFEAVIGSRCRATVGRGSERYGEGATQLNLKALSHATARGHGADVGCATEVDKEKERRLSVGSDIAS